MSKSPSLIGFSKERGSITPFIALFVVITAGLTMGVARFGAEAAIAAQARTAADAAALAGAAEGEQAARQVAHINGARLVSFSVEGREAQVTVELDGTKVSARAQGSMPDSPHGTGAKGLHPQLLNALARAEALLGKPVPISSGWRSAEQQQRLYDNRGSNPYPVAKPGSSKHEQGLAIDVPLSFVPTLARIAGDVELCQPVAKTDPVHFELCRLTLSH